jgi:hypothetical protein
MPAERLSRAVPLALAIIAGVDAAPNDNKVALNQAVNAAIKDGEDVEAVVLALANMAHAAVATLARQTGTPVEKLLGLPDDFFEIFAHLAANGSHLPAQFFGRLPELFVCRGKAGRRHG